MFLVRLVQVNFTLNARKHSVYFAEQAQRAVEEGPQRGSISETEDAGVEALRKDLAQAILAWDSEADLDAFTFNVSIDEIKDGRAWVGGGCSLGVRFKVATFNPWR